MPFDPAFVRSRLDGRPVYWYDSLESTMIAAAEAADKGCPSGTVIGAEEQTAGQGRHGRTWHSPAGEGLYFTVVLRLKVPAQQLPVVTLALGLAVKDAIHMVSNVECDLRWPNDVLIEERKCAGILTHHQNQAVLAGIGINVNQAAFPQPLTGIATSLRMAAGRPIWRESLLVVLLQSIDSYVRILTASGVTQILRLFSAASSYAHGRHVSVELPEGPVLGQTAGLTPEGFLRLRTGEGREVTIFAGGVRPVLESS